VINFVQMPADILVITPSAGLGETIRRTLEETTLYRIHLASNKASAMVYANEVGPPLAMFDLAFGDDWVREIVDAMRAVRPGINVIILCDDNETPPAFDNLRPWILVRKPFKMANFMTAISQPQSAPAQSSSGAGVNLPWLNDATKAAQYLMRITLESSAQAALITRKNDLWAYAGGLSQSAAKEVAQTVSRNWDEQKDSDLLRFIRLESTKDEHMLYATRLATDAVLAFVFDAKTPFSTIRNQASQLVTDLSANKFEPQKIVKPDSTPTVRLTDYYADDENDIDIPLITDIITDVPSPNPSSAPVRPTKEKEFDPNETRVSASLSDAFVFSRETTPAVKLTKNQPQKSTAATPAHAQPQTAFDDVEVTAPSRAQNPKAIAQPQTAFDEVEAPAPPRRRSRPPTPVAPPVSEMDVTRESATTEAARKLVVEPVSAGLYHLTYACLLVPRFPSHHITGDLSTRLSEWLPNICVAFGWRLEYLSVRPEYLQWVVNVQPNTSPGQIMRVMRQQTSEKIFEDFVRLERENPSGDFWAPGYLIMGGTQPHPPQLVSDYIRQTRERQGQEFK